MATKQVIVVRKDLKMRRGKEIAQGSHASESFVMEQIAELYKNRHRNNLPDGLYLVAMTRAQVEWVMTGHKKVTLQVNSEEELLQIAAKAEEASLECHVITDSGLTEFNGVATKTCLAIGPDEEEKINPITGHLSPY